ncbi:MAG: trypsin-like peptidase domain-containing protein, partial [Armatimonadota bacterium]|nr:trypsin-like peptidase domain-containing protein [Armatimonadota bacterium]
MRSEKGTAFGYFLAALLGALVGGLLVAQWAGRGTPLSPTKETAPGVTQTAAGSAAPGTETGSVTWAVKRVGPAVVSIKTKVLRPREDIPSIFRDFFGDDALPIPEEGQGSGVIIDAARGYVLTNAHVVKGARAITVTLPDQKSVEGKVVGADVHSDIAVVRIPAHNLPQAELARGGTP